MVIQYMIKRRIRDLVKKAVDMIKRLRPLCYSSSLKGGSCVLCMCICVC